MMGLMAWRDKASKYGFPLFIVVAIIAGALMLVAISQRTPPSDAAAQPYPASATPKPSATPTPSAAPATTRPPTDTATSSASAPTAPVRLAVFGGETTNGNSPDFVGKKLGDTSWVNYVAGPRVNVVSGWADLAASSQRIAAAARPVSAAVLVIDFGVEDQINKTPFSETTTNIGKIVQTVDAPKVILLAAPPFVSAPNAASTLNTQLRQLANDRGWTFVDAAEVRDGTGYKNGTSDDGRKPNATGAQVIGAAVKAAILTS